MTQSAAIGAALKPGEFVEFIEDCIINGRRRAKKGDKGFVCTQHGEISGYTVVKLHDKHYPIHDVLVSILKRR